MFIIFNWESLVSSSILVEPAKRRLREQVYARYWKIVNFSAKGPVKAKQGLWEL